METVVIIGSILLGICLANTIVLLIMGDGTPKYIRYITWISMVPLTICFSILSAAVKENAECKVKYKKVRIELYEKVE